MGIDQCKNKLYTFLAAILFTRYRMRRDDKKTFNEEKHAFANDLKKYLPHFIIKKDHEIAKLLKKVQKKSRINIMLLKIFFVCCIKNYIQKKMKLLI